MVLGICHHHTRSMNGVEKLPDLNPRCFQLDAVMQG